MMEVMVSGQVHLGGAKAALEMVKLVNDVAKILNTARTCVIEVQNHTKHDLKLIDHRHDHGGFKVPPNQRLPANHAEVFGSQSKAWSVGTGIEGSATYQIGNGDARARLRWNVPFAGSNDVHGTATGGWEGSSGFGSLPSRWGHDAHMKSDVLRASRDDAVADLGFRVGEMSVA